MKNYLKTILLAIVAFALVTANVYAEENEVKGLHEALSNLLIENCFTPEEIEEMDKSFTEWYDNWLTSYYIPGWRWLHKLETDESAEKMYNKMKEDAVLDFSKGVRISTLQTRGFNYIDEYGVNGRLEYLFSNSDYWAVPGKTYSERGSFTPEGEMINEEYNKDYYINHVPVHFQNGSIEFLKSEELIEEMLVDYEITEVLNMKLFSLGDILVLYINTDKGEYSASLFCASESKSTPIYNLKHLRIYPMSHFFELCIESAKSNNERYQIKSKPTYEAEAQTLKEAGLLHGNEKGLDLLKPLTRIEAAAMLLRAIGESETSEGGAQVFSDVPETHWGFGAAANAYRRGLIYGIGDGIFAPDEKVTGTQFASMILRAAGETDFDWQNALNILVEREIITEENTKTMDLFTRGDMAKIIYEFREKGLI